MTNSTLNRDEVGKRAKGLYDQQIRTLVETPENIGKMVIIDVETGEYGVDDTGLETSRRFHIGRPEAPLFGIRIGYDAADALGGVVERTA